MNEFAWSWNEPRPAIDPARFTEHRQETETDLQRAIRYYLEADKKALEEQEAKEEAFFAQSTVGKKLMASLEEAGQREKAGTKHHQQASGNRTRPGGPCFCHTEGASRLSA